jgi:hypothetical protein
MCWLLVAAAVPVLVAVEQLYQLLLLLLAVAAAAVVGEQNCGYLLLTLALLKQSLWAQVVLAERLEQQTIQAAQRGLVARLHHSVLGQWLERVVMVPAALQHQGLVELEAVG